MVIRLSKVCVKKGGAFVCRALPHSPNSRMHWAEKARWTKAWKEQVGWRCIETNAHANRSHTEIPARVTVVLYTCRPQDYDNSVASVKAIVDGLKGVVIADDSPEHIQLSVQTIKVNKKYDERVEIEL